jgi:hypothetical protein
VTRAIRWGAAALVAAGLVLSGLSRDPLPRARSQANGFTVLAGDFHVHGFPDGIPPWDAAREARRRRLDVIALTSHNTRVGWWLWTHGPRWRVPGDVIVLPGEELTSIGYHLALVGVTERVAWHQPLVAAVAAAHAQGAVAILAHPSGQAVQRVVTEEGLAALDGVEVAHPSMDRDTKAAEEYREMYARALAANPRTAAIGSSDFHYFEPLGVCRTYLFVRETTAAGVLEALRAGRTVACDASGTVHGPPDLGAIVSERCRQDASLPPDGDSALASAGTALVWAGLLALVLAGAADA